MKKNLPRVLKILVLASLIVVLLLTSCTGKANDSTQSETTAEPTLAPTPKPEEPKRLVVCLGEEPQSLYLYKGSSQAMWSVLEAIYDGPIDTINNTPVPVILEDLPTLENGGVQLQSIPVNQGDKVANIEGDVVALQKGVKVFPEGCTSASCALEWDGNSSINLVQMTATFKLLPGLKWSDGEPLTAEDSVFSIQVSGDPDTKVTKTNLERTAAYEAVDEQTIQWTGVPGYLTLRPASFFWLPLPRHLLEGYTAVELNTAEITNKNPIGWGAYQIEEWAPGSEIRLVKNPNYFKAAEGLPKFDELIFKFLPTVPDADLSPMVLEECDIMDTSNGLEDQIQTVRELEIAGELTTYFGQGPAWEGINFGIKPATYDEVYNPYEDRADFFTDLRTRQAFAYCIDRESINRDILFSQSQIPPSYLPVTHPMAVQGLPVLEYDTARGIELLEEVGWVDSDGDGNTPRIAQGVENVFNDTPFSITYALTDTSLNRQVAEVVRKSMLDCGVEVNVKLLPPADLLAAGPDGALFGRSFDLAQLSWSTGNLPSCFLYASSEIPSPKNSWLGTKYGGVNITGYSNPDYDAACSAMLTAGLDAEALALNNQTTQQVIANDLPVLPLYYQIKAMVARVDLCGLSLDTSSRSALSMIEELEIAETCPVQ